METYTLTICGLTRELPLVHISRKTKLANFSILGDVELVDRLADVLTEKLKNVSFDYLVCPDVKIVPLIHGVAKRLGRRRYIVCRKSVKPYMVTPMILKPMAHFPKHVEQIVINGKDVEILKGKKVVVIDDVVSTGVTMRMMKKLMENIGAIVVERVAVIKQGDKQFDDMSDLIFLQELPIFISEPL